MEVLKFELSSIGATFTRPYFNSVYTSYSHIHKVALLGLLGAIIGIEKKHDSKNSFSAYETLMNLQIAIVPKQCRFPSKINTITETTGMFNDRSTFLVNYEELIRPSWDIYILKNADDPYYENIEDFILNNKAKYVPYLGKNHFQAKISNMEILKAQYVSIKDISKIDSLFLAKNIITEPAENDRVLLEEGMPISINPKTYQYDEEIIKYTNDTIVDVKSDLHILKCNNKILNFI